MARLLKQWLELSQAEGSAIEAASWSRVSELQAGKAALQKSIVETQEKWVRESPGEFDDPATRPFRVEVGRLISLEARNAELLATQVRRAQTRQAMLNEVNRNVGKIRRSYVRHQPPTVLQCYS